jgi:hypothetical protein
VAYLGGEYNDWLSIAAHYEDAAKADASMSGVAQLVYHIRDSKLLSTLFGWTSMYDLCITQTKVSYPYDGPFLRISPVSNGMVEFRYIDTQIQSQQLQRTVSASETVARFNSFLAQLHWFTAQQ